jgi:UrcA family protein
MKIFVCAALAAASLTAPALAEDSDVNAASVPYHDLDLTTEAGRKTLDFRVEKAARQVCGIDESRTGTRVVPKDRRDCYREVRRQLDRQLAVLMAGDTTG